MDGIRGTWFVLPTPFEEDLAVDHRSLASLVEAAADWSADGVVALAVMSETAALSDTERGEILRTVADAARSRLPFIVGCSGAGVARVSELVQRAREFGAAAALVSAPPLLRNVDSLPGFFARVAESGLPLVLQDEPGATGVLIPVSVLLASLRVSGARAVKLEDPPTAPKIARLLAEDPSLQVFGGLGGAAALYELNRGACGDDDRFRVPRDPRRDSQRARARRSGARREDLRPLSPADCVRGAARNRSADPKGDAAASWEDRLHRAPQPGAGAGRAAHGGARRHPASARASADARAVRSARGGPRADRAPALNRPSLNAVLRRTILAAATNARVRALMSRYGMRLGAARFVAGENLDDCLDILAALNAKGLHANTTVLGEDVRSAEEAAAVATEYRTVLDRIAERELRANVALKLTHLGLLIDEELAFENVAGVVDHAASLGNFVRIDMEHSSVVEPTLRIYRRLRESGPGSSSARYSAGRMSRSPLMTSG